jgi:hypothetical protein
MTRQQLLRILKSTGAPTYLFASMSTADLERYCEGPMRNEVKQVEAGRLRAFVQRNRAHFAAQGQTVNQVVAAFKAGPECFAEVFTEGAISRDEREPTVRELAEQPPLYHTTQDPADRIERKAADRFATSLSSKKTSKLTREERLAKHREKIRLKKWAEQNRDELVKHGTTPEKVVRAFSSDDQYTRVSQFVDGFTG